MTTKGKYKIYYIYEIKNLINGKTYRGKREFWAYKFEDVYYDKYMGSGKYLKNAKTKYGIKNFSKHILTFAENREELNLLEIQYIACGKSIGKCEYNISKGGEGGFPYISEEEKRKMYDKMRGRVAWNRGKHHSDETRKRMSESQRKRPPMSEKIKGKISKKNKGKKRTKEQRKHLSDAKKGIPLRHTDEWNKHIGEANKGRILSEESRKKISQKKKGKTEEKFYV